MCRLRNAYALNDVKLFSIYKQHILKQNICLNKQNKFLLKIISLYLHNFYFEGSKK